MARGQGVGFQYRQDTDKNGIGEGEMEELYQRMVEELVGFEVWERQSGYLSTDCWWERAEGGSQEEEGGGQRKISGALQEGVGDCCKCYPEQGVREFQEGVGDCCKCYPEQGVREFQEGVGDCCKCYPEQGVREILEGVGAFHISYPEEK